MVIVILDYLVYNSLMYLVCMTLCLLNKVNHM